MWGMSPCLRCDDMDFQSTDHLKFKHIFGHSEIIVNGSKASHHLEMHLLKTRLLMSSHLISIDLGREYPGSHSCLECVNGHLWDISQHPVDSKDL